MEKGLHSFTVDDHTRYYQIRKLPDNLI